MIARDYTTNTNIDMDKVEDDLVRLEKENLRLRQQLYMMRQSKENEGSGCQESKNYEELMNEVDRLKSVVNKVCVYSHSEQISLLLLIPFYFRYSVQVKCITHDHYS